MKFAKKVHLVRFDKCILLNKDYKKRGVEDCFLYQIRPFQILGDTFWIIQYTGKLSGLYQ